MRMGDTGSQQGGGVEEGGRAGGERKRITIHFVANYHPLKKRAAIRNTESMRRGEDFTHLSFFKKTAMRMRGELVRKIYA